MCTWLLFNASADINGFLEKQDRGLRIEDRGSRIEDRVTQKKTIKSQKLKPCDRPARLPLYANVHSGLFL